MVPSDGYHHGTTTFHTWAGSRAHGEKLCKRSWFVSWQMQWWARWQICQMSPTHPADIGFLAPTLSGMLRLLLSRCQTGHGCVGSMRLGSRCGRGGAPPVTPFWFMALHTYSLGTLPRRLFYMSRDYDGAQIPSVLPYPTCAVAVLDRCLAPSTTRCLSKPLQTCYPEILVRSSIPRAWRLRL